jgi:hypothetical protein
MHRNSLPKIGDHASGVKIHDLLDSDEFRLRRHKEQRSVETESRAIERLETSHFESPDAILQELVQSAVDLCGADSAGISLEEVNAKGEPQFRWIAVAGSFDRYLNGTTPRFYSPCGTCIDRGVAQLYQVMYPYYNFLGINADPILDGILIPWHSGSLAGTRWVVAHRSENVFDMGDYNLLRAMADLVSRKILDSSFP